MAPVITILTRILNFQHFFSKISNYKFQNIVTHHVLDFSCPIHTAQPLSDPVPGHDICTHRLTHQILLTGGLTAPALRLPFHPRERLRLRPDQGMGPHQANPDLRPGDIPCRELVSRAGRPAIHPHREVGTVQHVL